MIRKCLRASILFFFLLFFFVVFKNIFFGNCFSLDPFRKDGGKSIDNHIQTSIIFVEIINFIRKKFFVVYFLGLYKIYVHKVELAAQEVDHTKIFEVIMTMFR